MSFEEKEIVKIVMPSESLGPMVGMIGWIGEVHKDNYYTFCEIESQDGKLVKGGEGGISGNCLEKCSDPKYAEARDNIQAERDSMVKEAMAKGDEINKRIEIFAKEYNITPEIAWAIHEGVDKIRDEVHGHR